MSDAAETILDADQHALAMKALRNMNGALSTIHSQLAAGNTLDTELTSNVLYVSEHYMADLGKAVGISTDGAKEITQRNAMLREANGRIRDLEHQLGGAMSPEMAQMQLKNLYEQLARWWKLEGFGHTAEVSFGRYGCQVELSCHMFGDFSILDSKTPVSDKDRKKLWHEQLVARGFVLCDKDRDLVVVDCEGSRKTLLDLFSMRLPSAKVISFKNHNIRGASGFSLDSVKIYIENISEIASLPVEAQDGED
jgi:hypothetical protein